MISVYSYGELGFKLLCLFCGLVTTELGFYMILTAPVILGTCLVIAGVSALMILFMDLTKAPTLPFWGIKIQLGEEKPFWI